MIYCYPGSDAPIQQGDIFVHLPRIEVSLDRILVFASQGMSEKMWSELIKEPQPVAAVFGARPVPAIVASQDCDASGAEDITLCEIRPFREVERRARDTRKPGSWARILTQHARVNRKWFYLPPDSGLGFEDKMAVDFRITIRLPRVDLEKHLWLRKGRLNDEAEAHFRERIAEFFRRYPYDEWYPLNKEEMAAYLKDHPEAEPRHYQI